MWKQKRDQMAKKAKRIAKLPMKAFREVFDEEFDASQRMQLRAMWHDDRTLFL